MTRVVVPVRAIVVDFDGTICPQDVSEELLRAFASGEWWDIDLAFQRGEIGSRECLVRQAALLATDRGRLLEFALDRFAIDPTFAPFATWARAAGVDLAVASDGMGFYVEPMLRAGGVHGVTVLTNDFVSTPAGRPELRFPQAHAVCVGCGTCKMRAVVERRDRLGPVAFVGEGHSDRYGALYADVVFATKHLAEICRAEGLAYHPWQTFDDVRMVLESLESVPLRSGPERCPGWEVP